MFTTKITLTALFEQGNVITNTIKTETSSVNRTVALTAMMMVHTIKFRKSLTKFIQQIMDGDCSVMIARM